MNDARMNEEALKRMRICVVRWPHSRFGWNCVCLRICVLAARICVRVGRTVDSVGICLSANMRVGGEDLYACRLHSRFGWNCVCRRICVVSLAAR